jgi:hypothetical protein
MPKRTLGFYVVNVFAFLLMLAGLAMIVAEGFAHYRPFFTHKAAGTVLVSAWTATPFIVGGVLIIFGALCLAYTVVLPALTAVEGMSPFIASLINAVKPLTGTRATDVKAAEILSKTAEHELKSPTGPT